MSRLRSSGIDPFEFKLHALTNEQGLFEKWVFAPADQSNVLARELLEGLEDKPVLGDKAYTGSSSAATPKRKNTAKNTPGKAR